MLGALRLLNFYDRVTLRRGEPDPLPGVDQHVGAVLVVEAVEYARGLKPVSGFDGVFKILELEVDEDLVWIVGALEDALVYCVLSGARPILVNIGRHLL
jgi:hypothetical protein